MKKIHQVDDDDLGQCLELAQVWEDIFICFFGMELSMTIVMIIIMIMIIVHLPGEFTVEYLPWIPTKMTLSI